MENMDTAFISNNIKYLRKSASLSQEEFAAKVGLNRGNIATYENGVAEPKMSNLLGIAAFFQVSVEQLACSDLSKFDVNAGPSDKVQLASNVVMDFKNKADELAAVLQSFQTYHRFKMKSMDAIPKDLQMMVINFEELFEVSESLLAQHLALIQNLINL